MLVAASIADLQKQGCAAAAGVIAAWQDKEICEGLAACVAANCIVSIIQ